MKIFKIFFLVIISSLCFWLLNDYSKGINMLRRNDKNNVSSLISVTPSKDYMPTFSMILAADSSEFSSISIPDGESVLFVMFDPYCPYCQQQMREIINNERKFLHTKIFFITPFPFHQMLKTYREFNLEKHENIVVAHDKNDFLSKFYNLNSVPDIIIFDAKLRLLAVKKINMNAEEILSIMRN